MSEHLGFTPTIKESYEICKRNGIVYLSDANICPVAKAFLELETALAAKDTELTVLQEFIRQAFIKSFTETSHEFSNWFYENTPEELRGVV